MNKEKDLQEFTKLFNKASLPNAIDDEALGAFNCIFKSKIKLGKNGKLELISDEKK